MGSSDSYFPRGRSVLNRVMRERAVNLLYGQRALVLGALQPVAFIGTTQRSKAHSTPWRRLVHTAHVFDAVFFGSKAEADEALAFTDRMHQRVKGTIGEQAGPYGPETPYDAFDSGLMLWVTAPVFDSARVLYETFVRRLEPATSASSSIARPCAGASSSAWRRRSCPRPTRSSSAWWPELLVGDEVFLTEEARTVALNIMLRMPSPAHLRPAMRSSRAGSSRARCRPGCAMPSGCPGRGGSRSYTTPWPARRGWGARSCRGPCAGARARRPTL